MMAEQGVGGVGFEVDGSDVDHVEGRAVGGDYESSEVAAHVLEDRQNGKLCYERLAEGEDS